MKKEEIIKAFNGREDPGIEQYAAYIARLFMEKKKGEGKGKIHATGTIRG